VIEILGEMFRNEEGHPDTGGDPAVIFSWYLSQREKHRTAFSSTVEADEARVAARVGDGGRGGGDEATSWRRGRCWRGWRRRSCGRGGCGCGGAEELEHGPRRRR